MNSPPGAAAVSANVIETARKLGDSIRIGTSSWSFPGWRGLVWDRATTEAALARDGLRAYSRHPLLRLVGVDKTYYRPAPREEFSRLREQVPDGFRFLVKAHEAITRPDGGARWATGVNHWLDCAYAIDRVIEPVLSGLGDAAGPILFQFSPMSIRSTLAAEQFVRSLGAFIEKLPVGPLYAVETRDRILMRPSLASMLHSCGAVHCYSVHPSQPSPLEQARMFEPDLQRAFVGRWMLHSGLAYDQALERYEPFDRIVDTDPTSRGQFAHLCVLASQANQHSFVVINNKAEGCAPKSVELLAAEIAALRQSPQG